MSQAFIFDFDGTLLDSEIVWVEATELFIRERKPAFTREEAEFLVYGRSWHDIYDDILLLLPDVCMGIEEMSEVLESYYEKLVGTRDLRIESSINLLKRLSAKFPVAVVSGSTRATVAKGLVSMGIETCLEFYLGAEDYSPGKPDPACYLLAATRLGLSPERCLVFEDAVAGVRAAKGAGMRCVAVARKGSPRQDFSEADLVLQDLGAFELPTDPTS